MDCRTNIARTAGTPCAVPVLMISGVPRMTVPSLATLSAMVALAVAACGGSTVTASSNAGAGGSAGSGGSGGGSNSSCHAPRVDRSEAGQCLGSGNYGVDESNVACCKPCGPGEVASDALNEPRMCVSADAGAGEGGAACPTYTDADKTCVSVADCATVAVGCYCGSQPVVGISTTLSDLANACETDAANHCALGCASGPGQVAEDGKNALDGGKLTVKCDVGRCHTVVE